MDSLSTSTRLPSRRSWLLTQFAVGLLIGALALAWAMHGLDMHLVLQSLVNARYAWVLVALACVIGVALAKTARWGALYGVSDCRTPFGELFSALMASQMVNVVIPIRVGELVRIGLMKQSGRPGAATLSTIVVEKALDLVAAGLMAFALVALSVAPGWLRESAVSMLLVGLMLVVGLAVIWLLRERMERLLARVLALGGWLPEIWRGRLLRVTSTTLDAFGALANLRLLARVLFWTTVIWLLSLLTMLILFAAFDLALPVAAAVVLILAITFSSIVPSPPALVGVMHVIAVVALGEFGIPQSEALGFGIVMNIVLVAPLIVLGGIAFWQRLVASWHMLRRHSLREVGRKL